MYEKIEDKGLNIYRFLVENSDRNINYILECSRTKDCVIIDPLDKDSIDKIIINNNLNPKLVLNTHAHPDHIAYNSYFMEKYKIKLNAHNICKDLFVHEFDNIFENDIVKIGDLKLKVLHTPGHCPEHISLIVNKYIFCGDTIFGCGVGNVKFRGDVSMLFRTIHHKMKNLPDNLKLLPGHDYLENNLKFLDSIIVDDNDFASEVKNFLSDCKNTELSEVKDIRFEKKYNPFFRIDEFSFLDLLKTSDEFSNLNMEQRFKLLRDMRDEW